MKDAGGSNAIERGVDLEIRTTVTPDDALGNERLRSPEEWKDGWDRIIDQHLVEWGRDPSGFDSDEIVPPSREIIHAACHVAMRLRDENWAAPLRVVPDGDGGIAFEHEDGASFQTLHLQADGSVELLTFRDCKIVGREGLPDQTAWIRS